MDVGGNVRHEMPDTELLGSWLDAIGVEAQPPFTAHRIGLGLSNLTYRVDDARGRSWVLRRPPSGSLLQSAHDVVREARIMAALEPTSVPVPKILAVRNSADEVPWVLMEHIDGLVIDDIELARELPATLKRDIGLDMARTLGAVHQVDLRARGLADLASTKPYAGRQLRRWTRQWEASRTAELPDLERLTARLVAAVPEREDVALVHGDFHIKNVITRDGTVVGVLDWELSTLGDPIADLGTLLAYWPQPGEAPLFEAIAPSAAGGFPSRTELIDAYAVATGSDCASVAFWHVLGLWKIAIIAEGVLRRAIENPADRAAAGVPTRREVEQIVTYAHHIADQTRL